MKERKDSQGFFYYYLKCGHVVKTPKEGAELVYCERCSCAEVAFRADGPFDRLEGRKAEYGERRVASRWDLPGFVYRPDKETDLYMYGNVRWIDRDPLGGVTYEDKATAAKLARRKLIREHPELMTEKERKTRERNLNQIKRLEADPEYFEKIKNNAKEKRALKSLERKLYLAEKDAACEYPERQPSKLSKKAYRGAADAGSAPRKRGRPRTKPENPFSKKSIETRNQKLLESLGAWAERQTVPDSILHETEGRQEETYEN